MFVVKVYCKIETILQKTFTTNILSTRLTAPGSPRMVSPLTTRDTNNHLRSEQTAKTWRRLLPFWCDSYPHQFLWPIEPAVLLEASLKQAVSEWWIRFVIWLRYFLKQSIGGFGRSSEGVIGSHKPRSKELYSVPLKSSTQLKISNLRSSLNFFSLSWWIFSQKLKIFIINSDKLEVKIVFAFENLV